MAERVNPDLAKERQTASFDPLQLTYALDGDKSKTERRKYIEGLVLNDPELCGGPDYHFLSRSELYSEGMRRNMLMVKRIREHGLTNPRDMYHFRSTCFPNENTPTALHTDMFLPTVMGQSSEEQQERWLVQSLNFNMLGTYAQTEMGHGMFLKTITGQADQTQEEKWLQNAIDYKIIGTYAQTEMGHGTFVRGLETTAVFDEKTDEFVIHSPTLTSTKWWPGSLGKTSNHAVVMATLYIRGQHHGMQAFMVQLRDLNTHQPLPGIEIGDIGPKFGYGMIDNGFLRFDHVRVPRSNMLMKNSQVQRDGTFIKAKHAKLGYGTMVFVRAMIVSDVAARSLAMASTIAIRYSAVRRQSELKPGDREPQILDYQTQQAKLFAPLASAYALWFAGAYMSETYLKTSVRIEKGEVDLLPELHALSACLKSFSTSDALADIEILRMACGGHGYSHASGIPKIYVAAAPGCTYEGENTVLLLQTARYLVKMYAAAQTGGSLTPTVAYLGEKNVKAIDVDRQLSVHSLAAAYRVRATRLVEQAAQKYHRLQSQGKPQYEAWNLSSVVLARAAEAHAHYFVVQNFVNVLQTIGGGPAIRRVLTTQLRMYAVQGILKNAGDFLRYGILTGDQLDMLGEAKLQLLEAIRPDAVALVDAFDFTDRHLSSVLGRYDGNVYENLYKWAKNSPLNETEVHESYEKYMKPFQQWSAKL